MSMDTLRRSPLSRSRALVRPTRFLALAIGLLATAALSPALSAAPPAISFTAWRMVDYNGSGIPLWEATAKDANRDGDVDFMGIHRGYSSTQLFVENASTDWGAHADGTPKLVQSTQDFNRHSPKFWDANGDGYYGYVVADGDFGLAYRDRTATGFDPAGEQQVWVQWCANCNWDGGPRYGELSSLDVGDINGDGRDDVVAVGDRWNPKIRVFYNQGGALVAGPIVGTYAGDATGVKLADLDGDGKLDIVLAKRTENDGWPAVPMFYRNNGNGTFTSVNAPTNFQARNVAIADANGDGKPDVFVSADAETKADGTYLTGSTPGIWLLTNNGGMNFSVSKVYSTVSTHWITAMDAGDLNGDGFGDFVFGEYDPSAFSGGSYSSTPRAWAGDGSGNFALAWNPNPSGNWPADTPTWPTDTISIIKYNGHPAIVTAGYNGNSYLYANFATDSTPPVITPNVTGTHGNSGWYTSNVSVSWTVTDNESAVSSKTGCDAATVTTDTAAGVTFTCKATSAGGTNSNSVTIKRDATPPTVTPSAVAGSSPYVAGTWTNQPVTVSFACTDATSGVQTYTSPVTTSTNGANQSVPGFCTDFAGNTTNAAFTGINIDTIPPTITSVTANPSVLWPPDNKMHPVTVSVNATDATSGGVVCSITSTTSNEGTSQFEPDIQSTGALTLNLRAEREGSGSGRVYSIQVSCHDAAGNVATGQTSVLVPHDQGRK